MCVCAIQRTRAACVNLILSLYNIDITKLNVQGFKKCFLKIDIYECLLFQTITSQYEESEYNETKQLEKSYRLIPKFNVNDAVLALFYQKQ